MDISDSNDGQNLVNDIILYTTANGHVRVG
ncbi:hypothetical protein Ga0466249_003398 [Sporomusaceae bacterium BoRhaA]|nr:hypothetical protein [Pelorhabdus rhamnosifermentans]